MWPDPLQRVVSNWITGPQAVGWQKAGTSSFQAHFTFSSYKQEWGLDLGHGWDFYCHRTLLEGQKRDP